MSGFETKISHIFIHYYSNKAASTCKLFISEPSKAQEENMGRLFGIFEINTPSRENAAIITQLINHIEDTYYSLSEEEITPEKAFEKTLEEANQKFSQILEEKKFYLVGNLNEETIKEKINFSIGVIKGTEIYLSYLNTIGIYLIHKGKQDFKLINIKKLNGEDSTPSSKLFSNFITGQVNPPDYLFVANSSFLDFITTERIRKTMTSLPIHKAAEYFKNSLLQHEGYNFASVMIHNALKDESKDKNPASVTSISELNSTESSTERLLAPSFWSNLKSFSQHAISYIKKDNKIEAIESEIETETIEHPDTSRQRSPMQDDEAETNYTQSKLDKSKKILSSAGTTSKNIFNKSKRLSQKMVSSIKTNEKLYNLRKYLKLKLGYLGSYIKKIPNLSKILLFIAVLLIILFVYSTSYFKHQQNQQLFSQDFQDKVTQIEDKINQAESNYIFGDENLAKEEVTNAQALLSTLEVDSNNQRQKQSELSQKIEVIIGKLRHITNINDSLLLTNLSTLQENNIDIKNLIYKNNQLFAFDSINNNIYKINLDSRDVNKIYSNISDIGSIQKAKIIADKTLLYQDKNGLLNFSNDKYSPINISLQAGGKISDFATYNNRLYVVDVNSNQIYRHSVAQGGYGAGIAWLKDSLDLKGVNSIGIDTNIWLLNNDGQIFKLNKGSKQSFEIKNLDPALNNPTKMITGEDTDYIYVLEPTNNRIVVLDKKGELITQYYSQLFDNLKTFTLQENEKKVFIVNDNKVYFFNLSHL